MNVSDCALRLFIFLVSNNFYIAFRFVYFKFDQAYSFDLGADETTTESPGNHKKY